MWTESSSVNTVNMVKKSTITPDIEFSSGGGVLFLACPVAVDGASNKICSSWPNYGYDQQDKSKSKFKQTISANVATTWLLAGIMHDKSQNRAPIGTHKTQDNSFSFNYLYLPNC